MKSILVKNPLSMRNEIFSLFVAAFPSNIVEQTGDDRTKRDQRKGHPAKGWLKNFVAPITGFPYMKCRPALAVALA